MYKTVLHLLYSSFRWGSLGYSGLLMGHGSKKFENHWFRERINMHRRNELAEYLLCT